MRRPASQGGSPIGRKSRVFTRGTWAAVGVLGTFAALQVGALLPAPLDPRTTAGVLAAIAWIVIGIVAVAEMRRPRPVEVAPALERGGAADAGLARKLEYLANLSHEIRTPITSILGYTDVLCTESLTPSEQLEHLETIRRNGDHLLSVVRDVLDLSRLDAGRVAVAHERTDVPALVHDVADMMRGEAIEKGLMLSVRARGPVPETILTDPTRLKQILLNLVANAVRFTDDGVVEIVVGMDDDERTLLVDVVDHGPGLTEQDRAAIFEPWVQGEAAAVLGDGAGLGLAVAHGFATLLGGRLGVESWEGAGSVFTLVLPMGDEPASVLDPEIAFDRFPRVGRERASSARLRGRVLLVEDGADTRRLLAHFLRQAGCDVTTAVDGSDALDAFAAADAAGRPFDLVVMDIELPVLDGWEATRRLRAASATLPVIAITAYGGEARIAACHEAGCAAVLEKPATRDELLAAVARHLEDTPRADALAPTSEESDLVRELPQVETLIEMFVRLLERRVVELEDALAGGETERLGRLAERLKSAAGTYGFLAIADAAGLLEAAARQGRDVDRCLDRLRSTCRQVRAAYRAGESAGSA